MVSAINRITSEYHKIYTNWSNLIFNLVSFDKMVFVSLLNVLVVDAESLAVVMDSEVVETGT